jgi:hypothetical protein
MNLKEQIIYVARNHYSWPGGYEMAVLMDDHMLVCFKCLRDNYRLIRESTRDEMRNGWQVVQAVLVEGFDEPEHCAHCGRLLTGEED